AAAVPVASVAVVPVAVAVVSDSGSSSLQATANIAMAISGSTSHFSRCMCSSWAGRWAMATRIVTKHGLTVNFSHDSYRELANTQEEGCDPRRDAHGRQARTRGAVKSRGMRRQEAA